VAIIAGGTLAGLGLAGVLSAVPASAAPVQTATFDCFPYPQSFSVPTGVTSLSYQVAGAPGQSADIATGDETGAAGGGPGGRGAELAGSIAVTSGELLTITVGCDATLVQGNTVGGSGYAAGGGGGNFAGRSTPGAGGGATGVTTGSTVLLVAGGGGGGGGQGFGSYDPGGSGGYAAGSDSPDGQGGSGPAAAAPASGTVSGGTGGSGNQSSQDDSSGGGGGGGGGYAGGVAGNAAGVGGGGGGGGAAGSSYADPGTVTMAADPSPAGTDGYLTLSFTGPTGSVPVTAGCDNGVLQSYTLPTGASGAMVTEIGASGASAPSNAFSFAAPGGSGAGLTGTIAAAGGTQLIYGVGCEGRVPADSGQGGGYADVTNPGGAGGQGWTAGGAGGPGQRNVATVPPDGSAGGGGGGGSTGFDIGGYDTQLIAAGGGGSAYDANFGDYSATENGAGGDAAGAPGTGSAGVPGSSASPGGGLASNPGDGDGGTGESNSYIGNSNYGGGGGGAGGPDAGGGGGTVPTGMSDYDNYAGGGGGGGSFTGGTDVTSTTFFATSAWRAGGNKQDTSNDSLDEADRDGLIVIVPLFPTPGTPAPVTGTAPTITPVSPDASGTVGQSFATDYTIGGSPSPTVKVSSGTLPPGLGLSTSNGISRITGTPTEGGSFTFTLTATNGVEPAATQSVTIPIDSPPTISGTPPVGQVGSTYGPFTFTTGGYPASTVSLAGGDLPPGLTLSPDGTLSGVPTMAGSYQERISAMNGDGTANETVTLVIDPIGNPTAPLDVTAQPLAGAATVMWDPPASSGDAPIQDYVINGTDLTTGAAVPSQNTLGQTNQTEALVPDLTSGDSYDFTVTAVNENDQSGPPSTPSSPIIIDSETSCPSTQDLSTPPGTAVDVTASCTGNDVSYSVEQGPAGGTLVDDGGGQFTYTPDASTVGDDPFYILATGAGGDSDEEFDVDVYGPASATTTAADEVTSTSARLNATIDDGGSSSADYYFFYGQSEDDLDSATPEATLGPSASGTPVSATVDGLAPSTTYYFQVVADVDGADYPGGVLQLTTPAAGGGGGGGGTPPASLPETPFVPFLLLGILPAAAFVQWRRKRA
jgi:hypothetical protein